MPTIDLPYPPSINHYWRTRVVTPKGRKPFATMYISGAGKKFAKDVDVACVGIEPTYGDVSMVVDVYPPDRRKRDLDNILKPLLDALTKAGVWHDDAQVSQLLVRRRRVIEGGRVTVEVKAKDNMLFKDE